MHGPQSKLRPRRRAEPVRVATPSLYDAFIRAGVEMNGATEIRPLIAESSTSESTTVEVIINELRDGILKIPDYQRDSDQWSETTKSLLVESVINNLSIPAFFFEVRIDDSIEKNEVVDGQQRLTTLYDFHENKFPMVKSDDAPYLSPNSVHYAERTFSDLPPAYQQAFKKYRLTVIKLRGLKDMRLEVFRRINQGGTPVSGQDIRLAYYGGTSPSIALIRLMGVYDPETQAGKRFVDTAKTQFDIEYPWNDGVAAKTWHEWWTEKNISRGQTASEMFLWSLVTAQVEELDSLLRNTAALEKINCRFKQRAVDEALDAYCAQLRYQDSDGTIPPILMSLKDMKTTFAPLFQRWIALILGRRGPSISVTKNRVVAAVIGASYRLGLSPDRLSDQHWTNVVEFIRRPLDLSKKVGVEWPLSKGRWDGQRGYRAQLKAIYEVLKRLTA